MHPTERHQLIDPVLENYRGITHPGWDEELLKQTDGIPYLQELVYDLTLHWNGAASTAEFPPMFFDQVAAFASAFCSAPATNIDVITLAEGTLARCCRELPDLNIEPEGRRRLLKWFVEVGAQVMETKAQIKYELPIDEMWEEYLKKPIWSHSVCSALRLSYSAMFHGYEDFLVHCTKHVMSEAQLRRAGNRFTKLFTQAFGEKMYQTCWGSPDVLIIQEVRNALVHAGGRETQKLSERPHKVRFHEGRLQIFPEDVRDAFSVLRNKVAQFLIAVRLEPEWLKPFTPNNASDD